MATFRQAIERQREIGAVSLSGTVSLRDLERKFHPVPSGSTRALLLQMFGSASKKLPWAIILCRFKGAAPDPALEDPLEKFYREIFTPGTGGLVEYWRDASLGVIDITGSRVFGWVEVEIPRDQAGGSSVTMPVGPGRAGLVDFAISAVQRAGGDPLQGFHSQIAIYTQNWSKDGVTSDGDWATWAPFWIDGSADGRGKVTLTPPHNGNITAHEMGHGFEMQHDVGSNLMTSSDYSDPSCIMSQNGPFTHPTWQRAFGPAICLPHLLQRDWMYQRRVFFDEGGWMAQPEGITLPLAPVSRPGARANLGIKLALQRGETSWDYYLEYVIPTEWNQGVPGAPYLFIRRIVSISGTGDRPAYLGFIMVPAVTGKIAEVVEPAGNVRFQVELINSLEPIIKVSAQKL